jgi:ABC-2 type transport system permease protein
MQIIRRLNKMFSLYKKDLQSYFYSPFAYLVCALFMLIFSLSFINDISTLNSNVYQFFFTNVLYNNFFYFIFLIPALTMKSFAEERNKGTETLILSSPISIPKIVIAKFLAVSTVFLLMVSLSFIYPLITVIMGQVYWSSLICGYIGFFAMGLVSIAIGILMSSLTDTPIIAAVTGEAVMLILLFVDRFSESALVTSIPFLSNLLSWFSAQKRFNQFSSGIFSLSDLIFYLTFVAVILAWTMISIAKRRWSRG